MLCCRPCDYSCGRIIYKPLNVIYLVSLVSLKISTKKGDVYYIQHLFLIMLEMLVTALKLF